VVAAAMVGPLAVVVLAALKLLQGLLYRLALLLQ
jgi:hypothetical protein